MEKKVYTAGEGKPPIWLQPIIEQKKMFDLDFFHFTNLLDWSKQGDDQEVLEPLIAFLTKWGDDVIFTFDDKMAELLYALDTREIADRMNKKGTDFFSPDAFLYSRCVALVNGKPFYTAILKGRKKLKWDMEFESILYVPMQAWARLHNKNMDEYPHITKHSYETFSNIDGWKETENGGKLKI